VRNIGQQNMMGYELLKKKLKFLGNRRSLAGADIPCADVFVRHSLQQKDRVRSVLKIL